MCKVVENVQNCKLRKIVQIVQNVQRTNLVIKNYIANVIWDEKRKKETMQESGWLAIIDY